MATGNFDIRAIRVVAMDLDGTLTQHKTPLGPQNRAALDALGRKYQLLMVGAGRCSRIFGQLCCYPVDIIGNYGLEYCEYDAAAGGLKTVFDRAFPCDREGVKARVEALRQELGFPPAVGDIAEFHASGCVTIPLLGTNAALSDKLAVDPDRRKRRNMYPRVVDAFPDFKVFIGGSSSFDMAPAPYDKAYALSEYCKTHHLLHQNVVYFGDDYGPGGNDEAVFRADFPCVPVDDYRGFADSAAPLLTAGGAIV